MKKVVVIGCAGSGKSTLAQELGSILNVEVVHLDALYWKPNWAKTPEEEWQETVKVLLKKEAWIMDGNFSSSRKLRFEAADTIVFLDFPRYLCLLRILKRRMQFQAKDRPDRAKGCPERLNSYLLKHVWTFPSHIRPMLVKDVNEHSTIRKVIVLRSPSQTRRFLEDLQRCDQS